MGIKRKPWLIAFNVKIESKNNGKFAVAPLPTPMQFLAVLRIQSVIAQTFSAVEPKPTDLEYFLS